jgi:CheY-like chemotaxis protein
MGTTNINRILMAEDDLHDAELTLEALRDNNLANTVDIVNDGAQALDYLYKRGEYEGRKSGNPAVILLDLKMPRLTGLQVLQTIKSDPKLKTIPVVILTSSREDSDLKECYAIGANAFVVKPVDFGEFMEAIKSLGEFWAIVNVLQKD